MKDKNGIQVNVGDSVLCSIPGHEKWEGIVVAIGGEHFEYYVTVKPSVGRGPGKINMFAREIERTVSAGAISEKLPGFNVFATQLLKYDESRNMTVEQFVKRYQIDRCNKPPEVADDLLARMKQHSMFFGFGFAWNSLAQETKMSFLETVCSASNFIGLGLL